MSSHKCCKSRSDSSKIAPEGSQKQTQSGAAREVLCATFLSVRFLFGDLTTSMHACVENNSLRSEV